MFSLNSDGDFKNMERFLKRISDGDIFGNLDSYGQIGTIALAIATPKRSGLTAESWMHHVDKGKGGWTISWSNSNVNAGVNIALILQYGHGTGTGGYVPGYDYINPAMQPIFDRIAEDAWRAVNNA